MAAGGATGPALSQRARRERVVFRAAGAVRLYRINGCSGRPYGGYLSSYFDPPSAARLTQGLGAAWNAGGGHKPHAAVTSIHTALDGLGEIMREQKLARATSEGRSRAEPITHVHCAWEYKAQGVTAAQMNLVLRPRGDRLRWRRLHRPVP